jgi:uncharacterized protein (TIGR03435 family)
MICRRHFSTLALAVSSTSSSSGVNGKGEMITLTGVCGVTFVVVTAVTVTIAAPQSPEVARFEVASIKPAVNGVVTATPASANQFYRADFTLRSLIGYAYDTQPFRVLNGPDWIASSRWEVSAKTEAPVGPTQMRRLVQRLLSDRFALKTHMETNDLPIYELVLARGDGRLGPNLRPARVDCEPFVSGRRPMDEAPLDPITRLPVCVPRFGMGSGGFTMKLDGQPIARFASLLQPETQRVVVDKTGLQGPFDIEFTYASQFMTQFMTEAFGASSPDATALATALSEQLGLRLRSARGPVDVIVVDHAEPPTPN